MTQSRGPGEDGRHVRRHIGNYELIRRLGRGGFSTVYLVRHRIFSNRPPVALKRLQTTLESEEARARFIEEARLLEQLRHPHILPLVDAGIDVDGSPYLVTAYASGGSLRERLRRAGGHALPLEEVLAIIAQIGEALQYAHRRGVIHRDLKPENILFTQHGEALLSDFGIALLLGSQSVEQATVSGTPAYMAPEQFRGQVSRQSDQYALACVAYELCTGRRVFEERDALVLMYKHTQEEPEPPRRYNIHLPEVMERAILRGLAKERGARYPDVQSFVAALHAFRPFGGDRPDVPDEDDYPDYDADYSADDPPDAIPDPGSDPDHPAFFRKQPAPRDATRRRPGGAAVTRAIWGAPAPASGPRPSAAATPATLHLSAQETAFAGAAADPEDVELAGGSVGAAGSVGPADALESAADLATRSREGVAADDWQTGPAIIQLSRPLRRSAAPVPPPRPRRIMRTAPPLTTPAPSEDSLPPGATPSRSAPGPARRSSSNRSARRLALLRWPWLLLPVALLLVLLLVATPVTLFVVLPRVLPAATLTITPQRHALQRSYTLTARVGAALDPAHHLLPALLLTTPPQSRSRTVSASGRASTPGTRAQGVLTFYNGKLRSQVVPANTVIKDPRGIAIVTEADVVIPAGNPPNLGSASVNAHALLPGIAGNIPADDINSTCCSTDNTIFVKNLVGFTGGQDPQSYTFVQQSDIDSAAQAIEPDLLQSARTALSGLQQSGEERIGAPRCPASVTSDHRAGDRASSVNVSVSITCAQLVYDRNSLQTVVAALLTSEAQHDYGSDYLLQGTISVQISGVQQSQANAALLTVQASGLWLYRFSDARLAALKRLVRGLDPAQASALLRRQPGVADVSLSLALGRSTLPGDVTQISILIRT
jgi:serine/threonine protein kinase